MRPRSNKSVVTISKRHSIKSVIINKNYGEEDAPPIVSRFLTSVSNLLAFYYVKSASDRLVRTQTAQQTIFCVTANIIPY